MSDDNLDKAVLGEQVTLFVESRVGQYLINKADEQRWDNLEKLTKCDPEDAKTIRSLQNEIRIAESIKDWLSDAVAEGLSAMKILEDRE